MKISHLTFGQLYKLSHATTIMRIMRAPFSVQRERVIQFLQGPELKAALKAAAAAQDVPFVPGAALELCRFRWSQLAYAHANIIYTFCKLSGAIVHVHTEGSDVVVRVDTTPLGIAALNYKPGLKWKTLKQECAIENTYPHTVFWWLNLVQEPLDDDDRVNPAVWPCNTPRVAELAESLVTRAS